MLMRTYFNAHNLLKEDLIDEDQWNTLVSSIVRETSRKAFVGFWEITRKDFPEDFADVVDQAMKATTREI